MDLNFDLIRLLFQKICEVKVSFPIRLAVFWPEGRALMKLDEFQSHFYQVSGLIKRAASVAGLTPDTRILKPTLLNLH